MKWDEEKFSKLDFVGGLVVVILGITHIILAVLLAQVGYYRESIIPAVYGCIFLPGGLVFFAVSLKDKLRIKRLIINASCILLLMGGISNLILLITMNIGTQTFIQILFLLHIVLCGLTLPITFLGYVVLENLDKREKLSYFSIVLLRGSGIFHLLQPVIYTLTLETQGMFLFGVLYLLVTVFLIRRKESKGVQLIGFLLPIIGAILGMGVLFMNPTPYVIVFLIFDVIIIAIRLYYFKTR